MLSFPLGADETTGDDAEFSAEDGGMDTITESEMDQTSDDGRSVVEEGLVDASDMDESIYSDYGEDGGAIAPAMPDYGASSGGGGGGGASYPYQDPYVAPVAPVAPVVAPVAVPEAQLPPGPCPGGVRYVIGGPCVPPKALVDKVPLPKLPAAVPAPTWSVPALIVVLPLLLLLPVSVHAPEPVLIRARGAVEPLASVPP